MITTIYPVEVSGWDHEQTFFVEKTTLDWEENGAKLLQLRNTLGAEAIVFVRLIKPTDERSTYPVAYQTGNVSLPDASGVRTVRLREMHPTRRTVQPRPAYSGGNHTMEPYPRHQES